jgi:hypothetical protein
MINKLCKKEGKEIRITIYITKPGTEELYHVGRDGRIGRIDNNDNFLVEEYQYIVKSGWDDLFQVDNEDMKELDPDLQEGLR